MNNLAGDPKYKDVLERMRKAHHEWYRDTMDVGLIPEPMFDEMKRPGGKYEKTAEPVFIKQTEPTRSGGAVTIACSTQGASIAWRIGGDPKSATGWELYVKPVRLKPQEVLYAKACRIGFQDSDVVDIQAGRPRQGQARDDADETLARGGRSKRPAPAAREAQRVRLSGTERHADLPGLPEGRRAGRSVLGGGRSARLSRISGRLTVKPAVAALLQDPSVVVRIAAAHALCDWGEEKTALPVLVEALKHPTDKVRLFAVIALDKIGEKARPALAEIEALTKDRDEYVKRVATTVLGRLQAEGGKKP